MAEPKLTREFSLCLLPDDETAADIEALRSELPPSPYRDDRPHVTIHGVTAPEMFSDGSLVRSLAAMNLAAGLPLEATVDGAVNRSNQYYRSSGLLLLHPDKALLDYRSHVIDTLSEHGYKRGPEKEDDFTPHVTIRLGIPLEGKLMRKAEQMFQGRSITFSDWFVLRLILDSDRRLMREVLPVYGPDN